MSTDWKDGPCFYVSVRDGERFAFLLGPFQDEVECRQYAYYSPEDGGDPAKHNALMKLCEADPRSPWYAYGMAKAPTGRRNALFGERLEVSHV